MDHQDDNQPYTPYAPPTADIRFRSGMEDMPFIPGGRAVPAGNAFSWISGAWGLFKQQPGSWIGFLFVYVLLSILVSFVGDAISNDDNIANIIANGITSIIAYIIANIIVVLMQILLIAGVICSCDLLRREGAFTFGNLFAAFNRKTGSLLIACLIAYGLLCVLIIICVVLIGGSVLYGMFGSSLSETATSSGVGVIVGGLVMLVSFIACAMAVWFMPALVMMHGITPFKALEMSISACLKNILPGIVFSLAITVLMLISAIPLGLGLLVTIPMFFICYYTSYYDIFFGEEN
jgi:uncharacterized membrane protein